jgi:hypothetical protein
MLDLGVLMGAPVFAEGVVRPPYPRPESLFAAILAQSTGTVLH